MFLIDHHIHTSRYSPDSVIDPFELIERAREAGLSGVAITEHDTLWPEDELDELRAAADDLIVLGGVEVSAREGHFLVYGLPSLEGLDPGVPLRELAEVAARHGAAVVAAHPFRWEQEFDQIADEHPGALAALELASNNVSCETRARTERVARRLGLATTGSSDAHVPSVVGCYASAVPDPVRTLPDFIRALHARRVRPRHRPGVRLACGPVD